jgi:hypothetical protein
MPVKGRFFVREVLKIAKKRPLCQRKLSMRATWVKSKLDGHGLKVCDK